MLAMQEGRAPNFAAFTESTDTNMLRPIRSEAVGTSPSQVRKTASTHDVDTQRSEPGIPGSPSMDTLKKSSKKKREEALAVDGSSQPALGASPSSSIEVDAAEARKAKLAEQKRRAKEAKAKAEAESNSLQPTPDDALAKISSKINVVPHPVHVEHSQAPAPTVTPTIVVNADEGNSAASLSESQELAAAKIQPVPPSKPRSPNAPPRSPAMLRRIQPSSVASSQDDVVVEDIDSEPPPLVKRKSNESIKTEQPKPHRESGDSVKSATKHSLTSTSSSNISRGVDLKRYDSESSLHHEADVLDSPPSSARPRASAEPKRSVSVRFSISSTASFLIRSVATIRSCSSQEVQQLKIQRAWIRGSDLD